MKRKTLARLTSLCFAAAAGIALTAGSARAADDVVKIGFITDMSGLYADIDGQGGLEAIRMAVADFGGKVNGKPIQILTRTIRTRPISLPRAHASGSIAKASRP